MPRSTARLKVVAGRAIYDPREPEQELAFLFAREAAALRELTQIRVQLEDARRRFADSNQLRANPRMELLRARFGPKP